MRLGLLHQRIRVEEKLLADELSRRGLDFELIDSRHAGFDVNDGSWRSFDAVLDRSISHSQGLAAVRILESFGVPCVNSSHVIDTCGDKLTTTLALVADGVPTP